MALPKGTHVRGEGFQSRMAGICHWAGVRFEEGWTYARIGDEIGVSRQHVRDYVWRYVTRHYFGDGLFVGGRLRLRMESGEYYPCDECSAEEGRCDSVHVIRTVPRLSEYRCVLRAGHSGCCRNEHQTWTKESVA